MATAVKDEWTEEKCLQLIREYRARPILWDPKDREFFKKSLKPVAWREIGKVLNISPDKCKRKIIILTSSFRREKAKIIHSLKEAKDPSYVYKSTWFAFKDLAFLMDKENERKRHIQYDKDDDHEIPHNIKKLIRQHFESPVERKRVRPSPDRRQPVNKEYAQMETHSVREVSKTVPNPGPSQSTAERDEEIKSFTTFIGNKMKKYSDATKNAVQQVICDVIFKADQNYYDPDCYETFTIVEDEPDPLNKDYDSQDDTVVKIQNDSDSD